MIKLAYGVKSIEFGLSDKLSVEDKHTAKILIKKKRYQEAIWFFSKKGEKEEARLLKHYVKQLLKVSPIKEEVESISLSGATKPKVLSLSSGIQGVFKKKGRHPSSNYKSEVAAYIIDELYGFNLVPITVIRKIQLQKLLKCMSFWAKIIMINNNHLQ